MVPTTTHIEVNLGCGVKLKKFFAWRYMKYRDMHGKLRLPTSTSMEMEVLWVGVKLKKFIRFT